jgi:hypothetical protein
MICLNFAKILAHTSTRRFSIDNTMLLISFLAEIVVRYMSKWKMLASSIAQADTWQEVKDVFLFDLMAMGSTKVGLMYVGDYMGDIIGNYMRLGGCIVPFVAASFGGLMYHMFRKPENHQG